MNDWKDAKENPPPEDSSILIYDGNYFNVGEILYYEEGIPQFLCGSIIVEATHWMTLPDAPKKIICNSEKES